MAWALATVGAGAGEPQYARRRCFRYAMECCEYNSALVRVTSSTHACSSVLLAAVIVLWRAMRVMIRVGSL